jgi:phosphoenolpyruvate-protein kinase (PTS system EI component)
MLGAMIETPEAAASAALLARESDFLSIGTNDLTSATLGSDRFAGAAFAYHPAVLGIVARCVRTAKAAGIPLEVCGEAASDPLVAPLLVGLGVDELSVGAARVGTLRAWIRSLDYGDVRGLATRALRAHGAGDVAELAEPLAAALRVLELGEAQGKGIDGAGGVVAVGTKP